MSSTSDSRHGRLHLLEWPPERRESASFWGGGSEAGPRLVVVSAEVGAAAAQAVPDATAVVYLCPGCPSEDLVARELARKTAMDGGSVVWLRGPDAVSQTPENGLIRWFENHGIECVFNSSGVPSSDPFGSAGVRPVELASSWVLVARPRHSLGPTAGRLRRFGATVVSQPAIAIGPPADPGPLDAAIDRLEEFDWLVFSSANGVHGLLGRLGDRSGDLRRLGVARLAAVGPGTAEALVEYRLQADVVPNEHRAEALAEMLATDAKGKRFLLARASRGREVLAERLAAAGGQVEQVVAYESTDVEPGEESLRPVRRLLDEGRIDWTMVTSSSIARSLDRLFGRRLKKTRLASISPITSATLRELGHKPAVEAERHTMDGVIEAMGLYHHGDTEGTETDW